MPAAPATTMIPDRPVNRRERPAVDQHPDSEEFAAPGSDASGPIPAHGPGTGPLGNRAALRAQRQAVDVARRKAAKRNGEPVGLPDDEEGTGHRPRRVLLGLVAMVVVALAVLGGYTVLAPDATREAAAGSAAAASTAPSLPTETAVLPPLDTEELEIEVAAPPPTPVLAPVTVLNATDINGLAGRVAGVLAAGGWQTPGVGTYLADDIATSTVFYTEGDQTQRLAAENLTVQFPQLQASAVRFFEVPADVAAPGLVVVLTADWQP